MGVVPYPPFSKSEVMGVIPRHSFSKSGALGVVPQHPFQKMKHWELSHAILYQKVNFGSNPMASISRRKDWELYQTVLFQDGGIGSYPTDFCYRILFILNTHHDIFLILWNENQKRSCKK